MLALEQTESLLTKRQKQMEMIYKFQDQRDKLQTMQEVKFDDIYLKIQNWSVSEVSYSIEC